MRDDGKVLEGSGSLDKGEAVWGGESELRLERREGASQAKPRESISGSGTHDCKGPKSGTRVACSRHRNKASAAAGIKGRTEWETRRAWGSQQQPDRVDAQALVLSWSLILRAVGDHQKVLGWGVRVVHEGSRRKQASNVQHRTVQQWPLPSANIPHRFLEVLNSVSWTSFSLTEVDLTISLFYPQGKRHIWLLPLGPPTVILPRAPLYSRWKNGRCVCLHFCEGSPLEFVLCDPAVFPSTFYTHRYSHLWNNFKIWLDNAFLPLFWCRDALSSFPNDHWRLEVP